MSITKLFSSKYTLLIILFFGFVVRLYGFSDPIAGQHSWRQADTSAVSRNFVKMGYDILHPRFDDLSNVPSGIYDNPNGYRFVEFPVFNILQAGFFQIFGIFTIEEWGRLINIVASLVTAYFLYCIVKKYVDSVSAVFTCLFFLFLPFSIYYSRTIFPDIGMVTMSIGSIYFFDRWLDKKKSYLYVLSLVFSILGFLLKPYALFFTLPLIVLAWNHFGLAVVKKWSLWIYLILSIIPLILWRVWMLQYPEGIPQSNWLFNGGNIRFTGAYFYWIFGERIPKLILGYWSAVFLMVGVLISSKKEFIVKKVVSKTIFFLSFLISSLLYVIVVAKGNVQHDYYQILILPSIAIFCGLGAGFLFTAPRELIHPWVSKITVAGLFLLSLFFGVYYIRGYYSHGDSALLAAGKAVDELTPKNAKVIAPIDGDTTLLYYTNRQGWASFTYDLPVMIKKGADFLLLMHPADLDLGKRYKIVYASPEFAIFDLRQAP